MAKEVLIRDAEVLEVYQGEFENDKQEKIPYHQARVFQRNQQSDFMTVVKLKSDQVLTAKSLVGKKVNLLTEQKAFQNKVSYHFKEVI